MSVAIVADCHLGGPGGSADRLVSQLSELPQKGCRRLILLGDIFHVWVGSKGFETPEIRQLLPVLQSLREGGLQLHYIEGNRDFFIARSPYARRFDTVGLEMAFEVGGRRYLAVHGDGLNDRDRKYLFWRWLSKSLPVRWSVKSLPAALAGRLMHGTERQLSKTNFKHKMHVPEAAIRAYGERRLGEGYDVLLLGHFHEPRTWRVAGGEIRLLDAWFRSHRIEWLPEASRPEGPESS